MDASSLFNSPCVYRFSSQYETSVTGLESRLHFVPSKLYFLGCANPLLLFAYSNFSYINKRGKCDEDLCYICKTEELVGKKLFENCVLLTGDKNFLYIRMKKMVVITKTPAKPYLVLAYNFQTAEQQTLRHLSGMPFFLLTI